MTIRPLSAKLKICKINILWRHSQVVRQRSAKPLFPSSNLGGASRKRLPGRFKTRILGIFYFGIYYYSASGKTIIKINNPGHMGKFEQLGMDIAFDCSAILSGIAYEDEENTV